MEVLAIISKRIFLNVGRVRLVDEVAELDDAEVVEVTVWDGIVEKFRYDWMEVGEGAYPGQRRMPEGRIRRRREPRSKAVSTTGRGTLSENILWAKRRS